MRARGHRIEHIRELGRGAGGCVYLAELDGVPVAVKRPTAAVASAVIARHEALSSLEHDNLTRVRATGSDDRGPYVLLDHVDGPSVETLLRWVKSADELVPEDTGTGIVGQVARGLATLHDGGWVHRDVAPSNIMVGQDGRVFLGDFDTTVLGDRDEPIEGKPRYRAPEVASGGVHGPPADVFALGAVLFEILFGLPLELPSVSDAETLTERLLDAMDARDDLPESLLELVFATLARDPEVRPRAEEIAHRLLSNDHETGRACIARYVGSFEPTGPRSIAPPADPSSPTLDWRIKGGALAATVEYLVDRFGEQEYGRMVERLSDAARSELLNPVDPSRWYDGQLVVELTLTAEAVFGSPPMKLARAIGAWSADRALSPGGPYQTFRDKGLRRGTRAFMGASDDLWGLYYDVGEWVIVELEDDHAVCEITARLPNVIEERIFAYLDRALTLIGAVDHRVERTDTPTGIKMRIRWG